MNGHSRYNVRDSQVETPLKLVRTFWEIVSKYRPYLKEVLDLGAGDGRFALSGNYGQYRGLEIDEHSKPLANLPSNATIRYGCAFESITKNYDGCIGNPPYVKHHYLDKQWLASIRSRLRQRVSISLSLQCNLFVYFIWLAIRQTTDEGLIALIVPFEWTSRPSVQALRDFLKKQHWNVDIYRLNDNIFNTVLTTSSITIIDKSRAERNWNYFNLDNDSNVSLRLGVCGTNKTLIPYENRGIIWAMRGLSPGSQKIFTLTEGQRIHSGLAKIDVVPCVTSLKTLPSKCKTLNRRTFCKYLVEQGQKCWLIRSNKELSTQLSAYLENIPEKTRNTKTCLERDLWYSYSPHPIAKLLYSSGFVSFGPKVLVNRIGAVAVGAVQGIHSEKQFSPHEVRDYLTSVDFESRVVHHAGSLRKVEVRQMNAILNGYSKLHIQK